MRRQQLGILIGVSNALVTTEGKELQSTEVRVELVEFLEVLVLGINSSYKNVPKGYKEGLLDRGKEELVKNEFIVDQEAILRQLARVRLDYYNYFRAAYSSLNVSRFKRLMRRIIALQLVITIGK